MKRLISVFLRIWSYLFPSKIEKANRKLKKATIKAVKQRAKLRKTIEHYVYRKYGYKFGSKYIPSGGLNKLKVHNDIIDNFGKEMIDCSLRVTTQLIWK